METKTKQKPRFFKQAEFYMKRKGKAYFRNGNGKYIIEEYIKIPIELKYGKKYDFIISNLVDTNGKILAKREWD